MNGELDDLLRDHYRAAADGVQAGPDTIRRFQEAGRAAGPPASRPVRGMLRRWSLPAMAAAVTAAVLVAMAVFAWQGAREPDPPRPLAPPASHPTERPNTPSPEDTAAPTVLPKAPANERPSGASGRVAPSPSVSAGESP